MNILQEQLKQLTDKIINTHMFKSKKNINLYDLIPSRLSKVFLQSKHTRLIDFIYDKCIIDKKSSLASNRHYRRLAELLNEFEHHIDQKIYTNSFDDEISKKWIDFLQTTSSSKINNKSFRQSTLRQYYQSTMTILYKAMRYGFPTKVESLRLIRVPKVKAFAIYLTDEEVETIADLPLSPSAAKIRDLFIIGCCTALRYSDFIRLSTKNFTEDTIRILTQKTKIPVEIPIHYLIRKIV